MSECLLSLLPPPPEDIDDADDLLRTTAALVIADFMQVLIKANTQQENPK